MPNHSSEEPHGSKAQYYKTMYEDKGSDERLKQKHIWLEEGIQLKMSEDTRTEDQKEAADSLKLTRELGEIVSLFKSSLVELSSYGDVLVASARSFLSEPCHHRTAFLCWP